MSDLITESDLLDAIRATLPQPLQEGEFTVRQYREHHKLSDSQADSELARLLTMGVIEEVSERRWFRGHVVKAYHETEAFRKAR